MNKVIFVIPYFGKFNNYFQLFLNSCKNNDEYNWLLITDDKTKYDFPENVTVIYDEFENLKSKIQAKFKEIKISLDSPYKLCDFKPTYGYIFEEYVKDFEYWGYCDIDLIFGKINNFLNLEKLSEYDKIGVLGHFTIFKNSKEIRELFLKDERYKIVLSSPKSFKFDEEFGEDFGESINNIFEKYNKKIADLKDFADIYVKSSNFKIINYDMKNKKYNLAKHRKNVFVYNSGILENYFLENKKLFLKEYMYIHLQKRKMEVKINNNNNIYKIIPNSFLDLENNINSVKNFKKIKTKKINLHYFKIRLKNLKVKIKKKMEEK